MNPTTMAPAQIDTIWLPLMGNIQVSEDRIARFEQELAKPDVYAHDRYARLLDDERGKLRGLEIEAKPFAAEWSKRGGWSRYYLVQNGDGHYHVSRSCPTCFATTQFVINPMTSGLTERELVDLVGTDACTTCFPWAPTTAAYKSGVSLGKAEKDARRDVKTQARVEKAEKKVAYWEKTMERLRAKMVKLGGDPDFVGEPVDVFLKTRDAQGWHTDETESARYYLGSDIKHARESLRNARADLVAAGEPLRQRAHRVPYR
jgi:hypothetical protein